MKTKPEARGLHQKKLRVCSRFCFTFVAAFLLITAVFGKLAAEVVPQMSFANGEQSYVQLPQLQGLTNTFVSDVINAAIAKAAQPHLNTLKVLEAGTEGRLQVTQRSYMFKAENGHDLLSVLLTAEGRMPNGRPGYQNLPMMFDLANGQEVGFQAFFLDPEEARDWIEKDLETVFADILSNYLDFEDFSPVPLEGILMTDTGLSFFYPEDGLKWLSGRSASIHYLFHELKPILNLKEDSLLNALGVPAILMPGEQTSKSVEQAVGAGMLPGLPVKLGDKLEETIAQHKLLHDPEGFPEGQKYQLEEDVFRGTVLLSRDGQVVSGMLSQRINLFGLITGQASRTEVEQVLGAPFISLPLTQEGAAQYGLKEGLMNSYIYEQNDLRLVFDRDDLLSAVWLQTIK